MSVTLINTPPLFAFSSDLISLKFQSDSHLSQSERSAVNRLQIQFPLTQQGILLQYGTKSIQLNVTNDADIDGTSFPQSFTQAQQIVDVISRNYDLSNDFDIDAPSSGLITFAAKKKAYGFDFIPRVSGKFTTSNTVTGRPSMLKTNYSIKFALFIENINNDGFERIYDQNLMVNTDGYAELSLLDKVHDRMMDDLRKGFTDVPGVDPIICKKSCRKYYYTFAESYGATPKVYLSQTSDHYTALNGGLSYIKQFNSSLQQLIAPGLPNEDRFLKQGNNEVYTRSNQPQYLYFFNTRANYPAAQLMVKWYFKDEAESSAIVYTADIDELRKYAFNVQFDSIFKQDLFPGKSVVKYDIWLQDSSGAQISEKRVYHLNYQYREYVRYFLSWSSFGSFDSRVCYGKGNGEFELFQNQAQRILKMGYDIKDGNSLVFDVKLKSKYKVATGWLTRKELIGNRDFFLSAFKFRFSGGLLLPIKIDNNNIPEIEDGNNLFSQFFEYSYLFDDHSYSEGDNDEPGISSGDFFFSYGPVGSDPSGGFHETDPTVPSWVKAITLHDIARWNLSNPPDEHFPEFITLTGDQTFVYSNDINKTVDKETITLSASEHNFNGEPGDRLWEYHNGVMWVPVPSTFNTLTFDLRHDATIWNGNDSLSIRYRVGELLDQMTIVKLYSGESALTVVVSSTYGDRFFNGNIDTTLTASVYWGGENITDTIPESGFNWMRISNNPAEDEIWNFHEGKARKSVDIDHTDVFRKAVFSCEVEVNI